MNTIYIMSLESLPTRYTCEWETEFPKQIENIIKSSNLPYKVISISGENPMHDSIGATSTGAFLNFIDTNVLKNTQINKLTNYIKWKTVKKGDKVIFPDGWHSGILQVQYMNELLDLGIEIHSLWHSGSYDPQDFLGRKIKDKKWSYSAEAAYFFASTKNYFATQYHLDLFKKTFFDSGMINKFYLNEKAVVCGFPFDYLPTLLEPYMGLKKKKQVLFPHRIAPEKQVDIFKDLAKEFPDYNFIVCQEQQLTKHEYHTLLGESMIVFSANLQETLGISMYEGALLGAIPFVPDRLSYTEMYPYVFKYESKFTSNFDNYKHNNHKLIKQIKRVLDNYDEFVLSLPDLQETLKKYFTSTELIKNILGI